MQHLKLFREAAKQGGLFFFLMLWMACRGSVQQLTHYVYQRLAICLRIAGF